MTNIAQLIVRHTNTKPFRFYPSLSQLFICSINLQFGVEHASHRVQVVTRIRFQSYETLNSAKMFGIATFFERKWRNQEFPRYPNLLTSTLIKLFITRISFQQLCLFSNMKTYFTTWYEANRSQSLHMERKKWGVRLLFNDRFRWKYQYSYHCRRIVGMYFHWTHNSYYCRLQ